MKVWRTRHEFCSLLSVFGACALLLGVALTPGCGQHVEVGFDEALTLAGSAGSGGQGGGAGSGAAGVVQAGAPGCVETKCRDQLFQCGNCDDDDQDGLIDSLDPDCLGPCDDDESALSTGLDTSQSAACRQDCYFDGNTGAGNDKCVWSHACDEKSLPPDYPPSGDARCAYMDAVQAMGVDCAALSLEQAPECLETCFPLVPNGCDCFGCCLLGDGEYHFLGTGRGAEGCRLATAEDAVACPPCTPVESCFNSCEPCETCVGHLPEPGCDGPAECPAGQAACDTDALCDFAEYCVTGCCVRAPEPI